MPIYEFVCQACGSEFEKIQSFSDKTAPTCIRCQSPQVERRMSRPAIHFKGSGWYITDSKSDHKERKEPPEKAANGATGEAKTSETGNQETATASEPTSTKTETKAKPETKASGVTEKSAAA